MLKLINLQGKPCWILNTLKNVRVLDNHVGREVNYYMKEIDSGMPDQLSNPHYAESQHWIEAQALPEETRKVLIDCLRQRRVNPESY